MKKNYFRSSRNSIFSQFLNDYILRGFSFNLINDTKILIFLNLTNYNYIYMIKNLFKMKKIFAFVFMLFVTVNVNSQTKKAIIEFNQTTIDYGTIEKGSNGVREFVFKNTGDGPLLITNVKSTCGCTIPKKPEKPILPGESEVIQVKYDTKRVGKISKSIIVSSNASNSSVILKITGNVIASKNIIGTENKPKSIVEEIN